MSIAVGFIDCLDELIYWLDWIIYWLIDWMDRIDLLSDCWIYLIKVFIYIDWLNDWQIDWIFKNQLIDYLKTNWLIDWLIYPRFPL